MKLSEKFRFKLLASKLLGKSIIRRNKDYYFSFKSARWGGIFTIIDEKTGICRTDGYDEFGGVFETHPESGVRYKGFQIPHWEDLLKFAEEIHRTVSWYPYIGWDFAYTPHGWVLVEGNWGQFVCEYAEREGVKKMFDDMFDK